MRIVRLQVENFRGISKANLNLPANVVLVGDNNSGKSTLLEAIDLVLGPERMSHHPVIDEHDFYASRYLNELGEPTEIKIEVTIAGLSEPQERHFKDHLEWWDETSHNLLDGPPPEKTDDKNVLPALRVSFVGLYDKDEDDFKGQTFFCSPSREDKNLTTFKRTDKRLCGFLFLRTLRTGFRALSLERGSLLDIILSLKEVRPQMWEQVLSNLRVLPVADHPESGVSEVLSSVQESIRSIVPSDWAFNPHMRVSMLTREHLRKTLSVFMGTGAKQLDGSDHAAPFQHQGTGTINTLMLAMLSLIAELKQNVIFAMEEPEIAIPPHTQKSVIDGVKKKSAQALFTSHSPYVLEEFDPNQIIVLKLQNGNLTGMAAKFPPGIKPKNYRSELRKRFCEALLARRVLIAEGRTEYDAYTAASRRLNQLSPETFRTLENMGVAIIDAETDSQIATLGQHFRNLGKTVFAVFDKQESTQKESIEASVDHAFEATESSFEKLLLKETPESALRKFALQLVVDADWPPHLAGQTPTEQMPLIDLHSALGDYFSWSKGKGTAADLLTSLNVDEIPLFIRTTLASIQDHIEASAMGTVTQTMEATGDVGAANYTNT